MTNKNGSTKGQDPIFSRNPLTAEQAGKLAQGLIFDLQDNDQIARLLLLVHAFTFEGDMTAREGMLTAIEKEVGPMLREVDDTLNAIKRRELNALKGGAR